MILYAFFKHNSFSFKLDKPLCRSDQKRLYGLARGEKTSVFCSVEAYPPPKSFRWAFNNTAETRELQEVCSFLLY